MLENCFTANFNNSNTQQGSVNYLLYIYIYYKPFWDCCLSLLKHKANMYHLFNSIVDAYMIIKML